MQDLLVKRQGLNSFLDLDASVHVLVDLVKVGESLKHVRLQLGLDGSDPCHLVLCFLEDRRLRLTVKPVWLPIS